MTNNDYETDCLKLVRDYCCTRTNKEEAVLTTDPNFPTMIENDATLGFYEYEIVQRSNDIN